MTGIELALIWLGWVVAGGLRGPAVLAVAAAFGMGALMLSQTLTSKIEV